MRCLTAVAQTARRRRGDLGERAQTDSVDQGMLDLNATSPLAIHSSGGWHQFELIAASWFSVACGTSACHREWHCLQTHTLFEPRCSRSDGNSPSGCDRTR